SGGKLRDYFKELPIAIQGMIELLQFLTVAVILGVGSVMDIRTREIPNWISVAVLFSAIPNFYLEKL
ncbi:MAG: hypothetical protein NC299_16465, partial [Lachnospiraceae bacterium]|nr:hypothetical protein [Lachnospiraceae bacterium]